MLPLWILPEQWCPVKSDLGNISRCHVPSSEIQIYAQKLGTDLILSIPEIRELGAYAHHKM
jgi:hypothetical protein